MLRLSRKKQPHSQSKLASDESLIPSGVSVPQRSEVNWLLVGLGDVSFRRVIPAMQQESRSHLYGIVTRDPQKAVGFVPNIWSDLEIALRDPAIDAVYIATPVSLHMPQTLMALSAGKHVLCEKPMAMNFEEASRMVVAAGQSEKILGVSYFRRANPKIMRARELLQAGVIGRVLSAKALRHEWFAGDPARPWLLDAKLAGGGPLYDIGSHRIDILNFLFGSPRRVVGRLIRPGPFEVERSANVRIEYDRGIYGNVDVSWDAKVDRDELCIFGEKGELQLTPLNDSSLQYPGGHEEWPCHSNSHLHCLQNFVEAVLDGAPLFASGESSRWTDWVTQEAVESDRRQDALT